MYINYIFNIKIEKNILFSFIKIFIKKLYIMKYIVKIIHTKFDKIYNKLNKLYY